MALEPTSVDFAAASDADMCPCLPGAEEQMESQTIPSEAAESWSCCILPEL